MKDKLHGVDPSKILARELKDSKHNNKPYHRQLLCSIRGPEGSVRRALL